MDRNEMTTSAFVRALGVPALPPALVPFDPGIAPAALESHLEQSAPLMAMLKLSMTCWMIASESATRQKFASAARYGIPVVTGGGPFEIATAQGQLPAFLDLCANLGVTRVEAGEGFTQLALGPEDVLSLARSRGLEVQFELGRKHGGPMTDSEADDLVAEGRRWLDAGAVQLVVEARESAAGVGLFADDGTLDTVLADRFADAFGLAQVVFEAPTKASQFALLDHFGPEVWMGNVKLDEVLRVEIYRRGLHSDAFANPFLRPRAPVAHEATASA